MFAGWDHDHVSGLFLTSDTGSEEDPHKSLFVQIMFLKNNKQMHDKREYVKIKAKTFL